MMLPISLRELFSPRRSFRKSSVRSLSSASSIVEVWHGALATLYSTFSLDSSILGILIDGLGRHLSFESRMHQSRKIQDDRRNQHATIRILRLAHSEPRDERLLWRYLAVAGHLVFLCRVKRHGPRHPMLHLRTRLVSRHRGVLSPSRDYVDGFGPTIQARNAHRTSS